MKKPRPDEQPRSMTDDELSEEITRAKSEHLYEGELTRFVGGSLMLRLLYADDDVGHLDDETVLEVLRSRAGAHLSACEICRANLSALIETFVLEQQPPPSSGGVPAPFHAELLEAFKHHPEPIVRNAAMVAGTRLPGAPMVAVTEGRFERVYEERSEIEVNVNVRVKMSGTFAEVLAQRMPLLSQLFQSAHIGSELNAILSRWLQLQMESYRALVQGSYRHSPLLALASAIDGPPLERTFGPTAGMAERELSEREHRLGDSVRAFVEAQNATEDVRAAAFCLARSLGDVEPRELEDVIHLLEKHIRRTEWLDARLLLAMCYRKRGRNDDADDQIRQVRAALKQYLPDDTLDSAE